MWFYWVLTLVIVLGGCQQKKAASNSRGAAPLVTVSKTQVTVTLANYKQLELNGTCFPDALEIILETIGTIATCQKGSWTALADVSSFPDGDQQWTLYAKELGKSAEQAVRFAVLAVKKDATAPDVATIEPKAMTLLANESNWQSFAVAGSCTEPGGAVIVRWESVELGRTECVDKTWKSVLDLRKVLSSTISLEVEFLDSFGNSSKTILPSIVASPVTLTPSTSTYVNGNSLTVAIEGGFAPFTASFANDLASVTEVNERTIKIALKLGGTSKLVVIDAIGQAKELTFEIAKSPAVISFGFISKTSFRYKTTSSNPLACKMNDLAIPTGQESTIDSWKKVSQLSTETTYTMTCENPKEKIVANVRTLGQKEIIIPAAGFTISGQTYTNSSLIRVSRIAKYNPTSGVLDVVGFRGTAGTYSTYHTYNNDHWDHVVMPTASATAGGIRLGTGLVHVGASKVYFLDVAGATNLARLNYCPSQCEKAASWKSVAFTETNSAYGMNLIASPNGNELFITNGETPIQIRRCYLSQGDCASIDQWGAPVTLASSGTNDAQSYPFYDKAGNFWLFASDSAKPLLICRSGLDCGVLGNWIGGRLYTGQAAMLRVSNSGFWEDGSTYRIFGHDGQVMWGSCDSSALDCFALTTGVFSNFTTGRNNWVGMDSNPGYERRIFRTATGFLNLYMGTNTNLYQSNCTGTFEQCKNITTGWSTASYLPDNLPHSYGFTFDRGAWTDDNMSPAMLLHDGAANPLILHFLD